MNQNSTQQSEIETLDAQVPACLSDRNGTALFSGCDVQIVSGAGGGKNVAGGLFSTVSGGESRTATGQYNWAAGGLTQTE